MSLIAGETNTRIDKCEMPFGSTFRQSEAERYREIVRILKAWGVSTTPLRKQHRIPHRSIRKRTYYYWLRQDTHADIKPFAREIVRAADRRASIEEELKSVFDRLSDLKKIEDVGDEYTFKPSPHAYTETKLTIIETFKRMGVKFPLPDIVPDGEGGLVANWSHNGREVRLRFQESEEYRSYIYYETSDDYDVDPVSVENLVKRLEWLNNA